VQACATLADPGTRAREVEALAEAMAETGLAEADIVTLHDGDRIETRAGTVRVVPAWRWLLEERPDRGASGLGRTRQSRRDRRLGSWNQ
jgi:predicted AAA+ superfamily ATPase